MLSLLKTVYMKIELQPDEKRVALQLWRELRDGVADDLERLREVPHNVRVAILSALVVAMHTRNTAENLFE
jgi:hypothetical protein